MNDDQISAWRLQLESCLVATDWVDPSLRTAAVSLLLRPIANDFELLLIRRAEREGDIWSGHIGLPGGHAEKHDRSIIETATRETFEEVSVVIPPEGDSLIGALSPLRPQIPGVAAMSVHPFVWIVDPTVEASVSAEVAAVYWIPLSFLTDPRNRVTHSVNMHGDVRNFPGIRVENSILWGLTYRIVSELVSIGNT